MARLWFDWCLDMEKKEIQNLSITYLYPFEFDLISLSDNAHSAAFSRRSSSPRLIEDETFNDSDIINNLIDYEDGQEEPDSLRTDKI
ncbi:UNVERIFIED_CONTAM: hypothetical protein NCL1_55980 [Trichonephila clavipes]